MLGYYFYDEPGVLQPPQSEVGAGWYDTGDVIDIDAAGFVTVVGRVKRFAKIAGEMVALEMVERVAQHASPRYLHAAMVEVIADERRGDGVVYHRSQSDPRLPCSGRRNCWAARNLPLRGASRMLPTYRLLGSGKTDYVVLKNLVETTRPKLVEVNRHDGA